VGGEAVVVQSRRAQTYDIANAILRGMFKFPWLDTPQIDIIQPALLRRVLIRRAPKRPHILEKDDVFSHKVAANAGRQVLA